MKNAPEPKPHGKVYSIWWYNKAMLTILAVSSLGSFALQIWQIIGRVK